MTHPYVSEWRESRLPEWRDTDQAERVTLEAPELRPVGQVPCVPTSTGLLIGCAYRRPMPKPSADAERIQSALLAKDRPSRDGWRFWLTLLACVLVFVLTAGCSEPTEIEAERATASANLALGPVHPRVRGEQAGARVVSDAGDGSSPRARGTDC